jgi:hypothetical protein
VRALAPLGSKQRVKLRAAALDAGALRLGGGGGVGLAGGDQRLEFGGGPSV